MKHLSAIGEKPRHSGATLEQNKMIRYNVETKGDKIDEKLLDELFG